MTMIRIIDMTDMKYTNAEHTNIDMMLLIEGKELPFPFHYVPEDQEPMTLAVKEILDGGPYPIAPYEDANSPPADSPPPAAGQSSVIAD